MATATWAFSRWGLRSTPFFVCQWSWWWLKSFYKKHQLRFVVSCILYRFCSQIDVLTVVPWWTIPFAGAFLFPLPEFSSWQDLACLGSLSLRLYIGCIVIPVISWNEGNIPFRVIPFPILTFFGNLFIRRAFGTPWSRWEYFGGWCGWDVCIFFGRDSCGKPRFSSPKFFHIFEAFQLKHFCAT